MCYAACCILVAATGSRGPHAICGSSTKRSPLIWAKCWRRFDRAGRNHLLKHRRRLSLLLLSEQQPRKREEHMKGPSFNDADVERAILKPRLKCGSYLFRVTSAGVKDETSDTFTGKVNDKG